MNLLLRYIKNLGWRLGISLFLQAEICKAQRIRMPHYRPIYLRPFTSDIKVFREVFLFGLYGVNLNSTPHVIVDAGANVGLSSVFFAERFPGATIYAIEPEASNFIALKKNIEGYVNIKAMQSALWYRDTTLKVADAGENHWAFTVQECQQSDPASFGAISIASFMELNGIKKIDLLKMDIEGAERELFSKNYDDWLEHTQAIIIELHDWLKPGCSSSFFRAIAEYNIKTTLHNGMILVELNR